MSLGKRLSEREKGKIDALLASKKSDREIAKIIKRSKTVVGNYRRLGSRYGLKGKRGRKKLYTPRQMRSIVRIASNKSISAGQIKDQIKLPGSVRTLQRHLSGSRTLVLTKFRKKPVLTKQHASARLEWARKALQTHLDWRLVIWSDEKKFNLDGPDGFQYYWHDLRKEEKYLSGRAFGGGSVMIWAGFGWHGKTDLAFVDGTMNSQKYIDIMETHLNPEESAIFPENWIYMQDNAKVHTSILSKKWFADHEINVMEWPAYSPDLNPIENLWGILVRKVYANGKQYQSIDALKAAIKQAWKTIELTSLRRLVDSMPERIFQLISNKGSCISY